MKKQYFLASIIAMSLVVFTGCANKTETLKENTELKETYVESKKEDVVTRESIINDTKLSDEEKEKKYEEYFGSYTFASFLDFAKFNDLDKDAVKVLEEGTKIFPNLEGLDSCNMPYKFIKNKSGVFESDATCEDSNILTYDDMLNEYCRYFDKDFITREINMAYGEFEEDGMTVKMRGDRGSHLYHHSQFFKLITNTESKIEIVCLALYDRDVEGTNREYVHYDYDSEKWVYDFIVKFDENWNNIGSDYSVFGKEYIPHKIEDPDNEFKIVLEKESDKWIIKDFDLWY